MADGGFLVKFDGKRPKRCYKVSLDYDEGTCAINNGEPTLLPRGLKAITIVLERPKRIPK